MKKELSRRDFLKLLPISVIAVLFKDAFLNQTTIYPLYHLPYHSTLNQKIFHYQIWSYII